MIRMVPYAGELGPEEMLGYTVSHVTLTEDKFGKAQKLVLWYDNERGISVSFQMYDVAWKVEVGILTFARALTNSESSRTVRFSPPLEIKKAQKLLLREADTLLESGLKLHLSGGRFIEIVPADFPCFLAVSGNCVQSTLFTSEYSLDHYEVVDILKSQS